MKMLFTIGTQGRHDDDFIAVLKQHHIDAVIDIMSSPTCSRVPVAAPQGIFVSERLPEHVACALTAGGATEVELPTPSSHDSNRKHSCNIH